MKTLLDLPILPSLPHFLNADPVTPFAKDVLSLSKYSASTEKPTLKPSMIRRSRRIQAGSHFSYVTPLPMPFPYQISEELVKELDADSLEDVDIEDVLATLEPDFDSDPKLSGSTNAYSSKWRSRELSSAELFGLSETCLKDILPELDVGDAVQVIKSQDHSTSNAAREQLLQVVSGRAVIARKSDQQHETFAPWSLCYSGWQFGVPAGQLGDGRAISILTTSSPARWTRHHKDIYMPQIAELQLKGAGRTPYSRFADGLAVLRSSVREYLGSEAMAALDIPTSRALSLAHLPQLPVIRERRETGAVVCRIAPSWLRIGNFQIQRENDAWDALLQLTQYAAEHVFGYKAASEEGKKSAQLVLREVATRNIKMCAAWQVYGFMHGVMNTDNISVLGLTIDYGPYAFMDIYSAGHICNHSDDGGRYSYRQQPAMIEFAIRKLGVALAEQIGAELESGKRLEPGWASKASPEDRKRWKEAGLKVCERLIEDLEPVFAEEYSRRFASRLGLTPTKDEKQRYLFDDFLSLLAEFSLDFHHSFRTLCQFETTSANSFDRFLALLVPNERVPAFQKDNIESKWLPWLQRYQEMLEASEKASGQSLADRSTRMSQHNPRFILRQWILEEAIKRLDENKDTVFLSKIMDMCTRPFEAYGEELANDADGLCPDQTSLEHRRLCDVGSSQMLGFQCSCSS